MHLKQFLESTERVIDLRRAHPTIQGNLLMFYLLRHQDCEVETSQGKMPLHLGGGSEVMSAHKIRKIYISNFSKKEFIFQVKNFLAAALLEPYSAWQSLLRLNAALFDLCPGLGVSEKEILITAKDEIIRLMLASLKEEGWVSKYLALQAIDSFRLRGLAGPELATIRKTIENL